MMPEKLREIIENFQMCEGQEKLMYLLEFAEQLPDLPDWLVNEHERMGQVHECMSPVFIAAEHEDGRVRYHFDIPREAPTVRGYGGILHQGLDGLTAEEIAAVPNEFYLEMGLQQVITGQRLNGMSAILNYMKRLAQEPA
jgi:cysteine desulfuration protein SufE